MSLLFAAALAAEPDAEPFIVAAAHVGAQNAEARAAGEALNGVRADLVVVTGCSRPSLAEETVAEGGYRLLVDGRDPTPTGICLLGRVEGETALVAPPWGPPCSGPLVVGRVQVGDVPVTVIGALLPSRLPACNGNGDKAVKSLAGLVEGGALKVPFGPGRPGDRVIVAGNLNAQGRSLAPLLAAGLVDTGGARPPGTWSAGPVRLAVDHVLVPAGWTVDRSVTFDLPGSDHDGVTATFFAR
jgi:hypothetical protein